MPPNKDKHIHKFQRKRYKNGTAAYICTQPDCYFKVLCEITIGKENICNRCGKPFLMNQYSIRLAKPHCPDCHESKLEQKRFVSPGLNAPNVQFTIPDIKLPEPLRFDETISELKDKMQNPSVDYREYNPEEDVEL